MTIRSYQHDKDFEDVLRIYREVGWVSETAHETAMKQLLATERGWVVEWHGHVECIVTADAGTMRYLNADLLLSDIGSVATSRMARKQGYARQMTAQLVADEASRGAAVAILGIFEQGYYNQLGFGNGTYQLWYSFDPSTLQIPIKARIPQRLGVDDWQALHNSRLNRRRTHGSCSLTAPESTRADVLWEEQRFGLGYRDEQGNISHHVWCSSEGENGPYEVHWLAYQTRDQFLELMALIHSLGDQVFSIEMQEPPGIQLQDILRQPIKMRSMTKQSPYENQMTSIADWQARILDLNTCLAATHLDCQPIRFHLVLTDPITAHVPTACEWKGIAGDYTITLGAQSTAEHGTQVNLPTLHASVNAFTRLWLGVRSATSLSWTDDLQAPESLLTALDHALRLPTPQPDFGL